MRRQQGPRRVDSEQRQEAAEIQQRQRNIEEAQQMAQERAARLDVVA